MIILGHILDIVHALEGGGKQSKTESEQEWHILSRTGRYLCSSKWIQVSNTLM